MKKKIIFLGFYFLNLIFFSFDQFFTLDSKKINANNVSVWFSNNGNFNRDASTGDAGFEWPKGSNKYLRYTSGFWIGCIAGNDTLNAVAEYTYDYKNGYVDNNGMPQGESDPLYRIYKINNGDTTSPDYINWPSNQGAYINSQGKPYFLGTQTMFYSYTDAYPHASGQTSDSSLKVQILQTNWCYTNGGLQDVIFSEFKIINRSRFKWNNTYVGFWTADVIGSDANDAVGCDTNRNLSYTYNYYPDDPYYGTTPPAVGTVLLRSPYIYSGNSNDTLKFYDPPSSQNLKIIVGYKFVNFNIFNHWNNNIPEPSRPLNNTETYRVLEGLWRNGNHWINPVTNQPTTFAYSGDPVSGTGWIMNNGSHREFLMCSGPFNMNPNDTQSVIFAQVAARGTSNLNSITQLRNLTDYVQSVYDENFQSVLAVNNISTEVPSGFSLSQNYPNPFNPKTVIGYSLSEHSFVSLKVYDVLGNEIATLVNEKQNRGSYNYQFSTVNYQLSSGIYFYKLEAGDFTETKRMILLK